MRLTRRLILVLLAPGLALALWLAVTLLLVGLVTGGSGIAVAPQVVQPVAMVLLSLWLAALAAGAWVMHRLWRVHVLGPAKLLNAARIMTSDMSVTSLPLSEDAAPMLRLTVWTMVGGAVGSGLLLVSSNEAFSALVPFLLLAATLVFTF